MLSRQVLYRKKENTFHNANMPCSALSVILFIHCSTAFYDPVIIISQSYHHFKATSELCSSRWYNPMSAVRAWKGGDGASFVHTQTRLLPQQPGNLYLACFSPCSTSSACVVEYCQAVNHQGNQGGCFSWVWACLLADFFFPFKFFFPLHNN